MTGIEVHGAHRTDTRWLEQYLGLSFPRAFTDTDVVAVRRKLMTTDVFVDVQVRQDLTSKKLVIDLEEKWTTIPVVRGAYGGGTPLAVFGVYDMHAFGKLMTLGAETKKYGSAPAGLTLWAKFPRGGRGKNSSGVELWRDFRSRSFYDSSGKKNTELSFDSSYIRAYHLISLFPEANALDPLTVQGGLDIMLRRDQSPSLSGQEPEGLNLPAANLAREDRILVSAVYDDMAVDDQLLEGHRVQLKHGYSQVRGAKEDGISRYSEVEWFAFHRPTPSLNLAFHGYAQQAGSATLSNTFYLGGFDSVRGFPDGIKYGAFAAYGNFELRFQGWRSQRLKFATVLFADVGIAGPNFGEARKDVFQSAGAGIRVSIPKIHRLVFRLDWARGSSDSITSSGITAGLNQFFQPYRPL